MWLHVPASCRSVAATEGSTSPSEPCFRELERSATWSGKSRPLRSWQRAWIRATWMRRLSGMTCEPSTLDRGVAQWISSLRDSHASPYRSPEGVPEPTTLDGYGPQSAMPLTAAGQQLSFSRMFLDSSPKVLTKSFPTLPPSGSLRNGAVTARPRSVLPIVGIAGSAWPTPDAEVSTRSNRSLSPRAAVRPNLAALAKMWPTPTATDAKASGASGYSTLSGRHSGTTLTDAAVRLWATPTASDNSNRTTRSAPSHGRRHGFTLAGQEVDHMNGHRPETTQPAGRHGTALNPEFVELLMGLPVGWTDFACSETASSGSRRPMRCAI